MPVGINQLQASFQVGEANASTRQSGSLNLAVNHLQANLGRACIQLNVNVAGPGGVGTVLKCILHQGQKQQRRQHHIRRIFGQLYALVTIVPQPKLLQFDVAGGTA